MNRVLLQASVYRKFWFRSESDLCEYLESGIRYRWLVEKNCLPDGAVIAVVGETYNGSDILEMEVKKV